MKLQLTKKGCLAIILQFRSIYIIKLFALRLDLYFDVSYKGPNSRTNLFFLAKNVLPRLDKKFCLKAKVSCGLHL